MISCNVTKLYLTKTLTITWSLKRSCHQWKWCIKHSILSLDSGFQTSLQVELLAIIAMEGMKETCVGWTIMCST
jgi:hypothetical protein